MYQPAACGHNVGMQRILGAVHSHISLGAGIIAGDLALSTGSHMGSQNNIALHGNSQSSAFLVGICSKASQFLSGIVGVVVIVGTTDGNVLIQSFQSDGAVSALLGVSAGQVGVDLIDDSQLITNHNDRCNIVIVILVNLNLIASLDVQLIQSAEALDALDRIAVNISVHGISKVALGIAKVVAVGGQDCVALQGLVDDHGIVSIVSIGADLVAIILPLGCGTAEIISSAFLGNQLVAVLLAELDGVQAIGSLISADAGSVSLDLGRKPWKRRY